jgi:hypothetical protein
VVHHIHQPLKKELVLNLTEIEQGTLGKEYLITRALSDGSYGIRLREYKEKGLMFQA